VQDAESFYRPKLRPSGHDISRRFASDNGGAIASHFRESAIRDLKSKINRSVAPHPARFPEKLPTFFIDPGDLPAPSVARQAGTVLDIFAGSNTTGSAAEKLDRRWMAFEKDRTYLAASAFRFVDELPAEGLAALWSRLHSENLPVEVNRQQRELVLMEKPARYATRAKRR
jgi:site-specific DNA-methyltransferase (cytosine-N4-specific)